MKYKILKFEGSTYISFVAEKYIKMHKELMYDHGIDEYLERLIEANEVDSVDEEKTEKSNESYVPDYGGESEDQCEGEIRNTNRNLALSFQHVNLIKVNHFLVPVLTGMNCQVNQGMNILLTH